MHILLIEPDVLLAQTYQKSLQKQGFTVFVAYAGQEAIDVADQMPRIDCIVLEVQLPGLNGIAFLQELRSYDDFMDVPAIINSYMSPPRQDELEVITRTFGVRRWLYKPTTSLGQLTESIRELA